MASPCRFGSPHDAIVAGIVTIPQELRLVPALSIAENLTLYDPPARRLLGLSVIDRKAMRAQARAALAQLDFAPDPDARVDHLSFAERQLVAIAKAVRRRCRLLILDEPTAALETREIERLFAVLGAHEAAGRRDRLRLAPAGRGRGAGRPLHRAARRPRRRAPRARRVRRPPIWFRP